MSQDHDESRKWFESKIQGASPKAWDKAAKRAYSRRDSEALSRKGKVFSMGELVDENPEYIARAKATKDLRESLKAYAGSSEAASDLLFETKKEADLAGKDFAQVAREKVIEMEGPTPVDYPYPSILEIKPKASLANRLMHKLWKMGFPVQKFINKTLTVQEADK
jgi:hypothetical protein